MRKCSDEFSRFSHSHWSMDSATGTRAVWRYLLAFALLGTAKTLSAAPPEDVTTQLKTATAFHQHGDYAHSIPILKRIVQLSPRNYDANLLLGEDLVRIGSMQEALAPLQRASEARPADATALAFMAEAALKLGDYSTASEVLQSALERSGEAEQPLMEWADFCLDRSHVLGLYLRNTKRGEATMLRVTAANRPDGDATRESLLEESATKDPEQRGIWGELGLAQLALGKRSQAQESLNEAAKREPQEALTLRLEAVLAAMDQRWPDAERRLSALGARSPAELKNALATWPRILVPGPEVTGKIWDCLRNAETCSLTSAQPLGGVGLSAKDMYKEERWEQLVALHPVAAADQFQSLWRGVAFAKTDSCPRAIPLLEFGFKADEREAGHWLQVCYAGEGARVVARLKAKGNEVALHELRGDMLLRLRNDGAAAEFEYAEALKSRPKDPHLLARLADAYVRLGNGDQAKAAAQAALDLDAHESSALHTLAQMAMSERDYAEALVRLKQLMATDPHDQWTQVQLGVAYGQLGHPEEVQHYLAPQLAAGYPDKKGALHALLANALRKLGRLDEAKLVSSEAARLADSSLESSENGTPNAPQ